MKTKFNKIDFYLTNIFRCLLVAAFCCNFAITTHAKEKESLPKFSRTEMKPSIAMSASKWRHDNFNKKYGFNYSQLDQKDNAENNSPYVKGRFIIKFKSEGDHSLEYDAEELIQGKKSFKQFVKDKSPSLDKLNEKHKVVRAKGLFLQRKGLSTKEAKRNLENAWKGRKQKHSPQGEKTPDLTNYYLFYVSEDSNIGKICDEYKADPHVVSCQPDYQYHAGFSPDDTYYPSRLWGLQKIQAQNAWDVSQGEGVLVGVVDTGLDYNHPDIWDNVWVNPDVVPDINHDGKVNLDDADNNHNHVIESAEIIDNMFGWDFAYNDGDPKDIHGHGTHVAGTIAAVGNNAKGIIGVAPRAKILAVKSLDDTGFGPSSILADGLIYATLKGADVINNSWGWYISHPSDPIVENAVRASYQGGAVVVFAAMNSSMDINYISPQNMEEPIVVSAFDSNDERAWFSNGGIGVDVAAPGVDILSLNANGGENEIARWNPELVVDQDYLLLNGTSMAAPHVSGLAALILSKNPGLTNDEVRSRILISADNLGEEGYDVLSGSGRINALSALQDNTLLAAKIEYPQNLTDIDAQDSMNIIGTTHGNDFENYELSYKFFEDNVWTILSNPVLVPVAGDVLGNLDLSALDLGTYYIKLKTLSSTNALEDVKSIHLNPHYIIPKIYSFSGYLDSWNPDISGNLVVWHSFTNDEILGYIANIFVMDLETNQISKITNTTNTGGDSFFAAKVSGDRIVYKQNWRGGVFTCVYNNGECPAVPIPRVHSFARSELFTPNLDGHRIVWFEEAYMGEGMINPERNTQLYYCEIGPLSSECVPQLITEIPGPYTGYFADISGDYIVWDHISGDMDNHRSEINLYDIRTELTTPITSSSLDFYSSPLVSGNLIVWAKWRGQFPDIEEAALLYCRWDPISKSCPIQVLNTGLNYPWPTDIDGEKIIIDGTQSLTEQPPDIYTYNLAISQLKRITFDPHWQFDGAISGNKLVFTDTRQGYLEVAFYDEDGSIPVLPGDGFCTENEWIDEGTPNPNTAFECAAHIIYPRTPILDGQTQHFEWSRGKEGSQYTFRLINQADGQEIFSTMTSDSFVSVSNIPTNGEKIQAALTTRHPLFEYSETYEYDTVKSAKITAPVVGSTISNTNVIFIWEEGSEGSLYSLDICKAKDALNNCTDYIYQGPYVQDTSVNVAIPLSKLDGNPIYVFLKTKTQHSFKILKEQYSYNTSDTAAPVLSNGTPSGYLAAGTIGVNMTVTTNENATCRYDTLSKAYNSMANTFMITGETSHSQWIAGLTSTSGKRYLVRCQDPAGNQNQTSYEIKFCGSTGDCTPPSVPQNLRVTGKTKTSVSLAWNVSTEQPSGSTNKVGYRIYRNGVQLSMSTTLTSYTDSGLNTPTGKLTPGTTYKYTVEAYDSAPLRNTSAQSASVNVTTDPATPTSTKFTHGDRVYATQTTNVYSVPGLDDDNVIGQASKGLVGTIDESYVYASGIFWWNVIFDNGMRGWVDERNLGLWD